MLGLTSRSCPTPPAAIRYPLVAEAAMQVCARHASAVSLAANVGTGNESDDASSPVPAVAARRAASGPSIRLPTEPDTVTCMPDPTAFYQELLAGVDRAQSRIVLASLYLGTEPKARALVDAIDARLAANRDLRLTCIFDALRSLRKDGKGESTRSLVERLADHHPGQVEISYYNTPAMRGWLRRVAPERWAEVMGVFHVKTYVFDDDVLLSGANLSDDYFSNRTDRAMLIRGCAALADWQTRLAGALSLLCHAPDGSPRGLIDTLSTPVSVVAAYARDLVAPLLEPDVAAAAAVARDLRPSGAGAASYIFPTIQMGPFGVRHDEEATLAVLGGLSQTQRLSLSSAYFNLTPAYEAALLSRAATVKLDVITAAPTANGFYNGKGLSAHLPHGYAYNVKCFVDAAARLGRSVAVHEYRRPGWTFHAKGLWWMAGGGGGGGGSGGAESSHDTDSDSPARASSSSVAALTLIGSPNFGERSVERDLESQCAIATTDPALCDTLSDEREAVFAHGVEFGDEAARQQAEERAWWVPFAARVAIKSFM